MSTCTHLCECVPCEGMHACVRACVRVRARDSIIILQLNNFYFRFLDNNKELRPLQVFRKFVFTWPGAGDKICHLFQTKRWTFLRHHIRFSHGLSMTFRWCCTGESVCMCLYTASHIIDENRFSFLFWTEPSWVSWKQKCALRLEFESRRWGI